MIKQGCAEQATTLTEGPRPAPQPVAEPHTPDLLTLTTLFDLFTWYSQNLCDRSFIDPRGYRVSFADTDFVHLIKLKDKYGREPRNARMTIEQIRSGRITLHPGGLDIRRAQELSWARSIIESPNKIVPNWQAMGRGQIPATRLSRTSGLRLSPITACSSAAMQGLRSAS